MAAYGKPVLLRFAHEMHDNLEYPWVLNKLGNTAPEYVAAWQRVHAIFEREGATNVAWVWSPNTLGESPSWIHEQVYRSLYPGDAYVDWVGLNIYNTGPHVQWLAPSWRSLSAALAEPYAAITRLTDKPLILGEVGSAEAGGDKAEWISEGLGPSLVAQFPRVRAVVWFDIHKEEAWTVESSNSSFSAFVDALRQAHFMPSRTDLRVAVMAEPGLPDTP
jgi:beta-mannanase